ncbi:30S ribosomal protein S19 [Candidatus Pacearchaeota archaeon CG10_big_fil_rev_8_21_14_0_10_34_76]|nr:MAG: 30S ribosomal protein S19 [Candidatus Pacearchaeota archaeon CG10_big_fil_rev_8_21_14_0_10_34_76]
MTEEVKIRSKELKYRGKSVEELQALDVREVAKYLPARSRRSILRHFDVVEKFTKRCEMKEMKNKKIRTHLRDIVIVPKLVGKTIEIYDGKNYQIVQITVEMIGHRLGEFAQTRKRVAHSSAGVGATKGSRAAKK